MSEQGKYQIIRKYYLPGGDIYFTAGNSLFRVHRYFFERESPKFQELMSKPLPPGQPRPGSTLELAIHLEPDVTSEKFQKFLWIFYNPNYSFDAKLEEWMCILELACRWLFPEIKKLALRHLDEFGIDLIDRIVLYQHHCVDEDVLIPLFADLCAREHTLSLVETEKLGYQTAVMVFHAREQLRSQPENRGKSPLPHDVADGEVQETVRDLMKQFSSFPSSPNDNRKSISPSGWAAAYEEALISMQMVQPKARKLRRAPREGTDTTTATQTMSTVTEVTTPRASESVESEETSHEETETTRVASQEVDGRIPPEDVADTDTKSRKSLRFSRWSMLSRWSLLSNRLSSVPPVPGSWS